MSCSSISRTRQLAAVRWTAGLGATSAEALAVAECASLASARGVLVAAARLGLLRRQRLLAGRPTIYTVTRAGLRAGGVGDLAPARVSPANAEHMLACCSAAAHLQLRYPDHRVVGEQHLRRAERLFACARLGGPAAEPRMHRPDLLIEQSTRAGLPLAVEVELTVKAPGRLLQICRGWARCAGVAGVLYLVAPEVERAIVRAVESAQANERIVVLPLASLGTDPGVSREWIA